MSIIPFPKPAPAAEKPRLPPHLDPNTANATALKQYLGETCLVHRLAPGTIYNHQRIVGRFLSFVGRPVWEVTPKHYEKWMASVLTRNKQPIKTDTQRLYQGCISGFFDSLTADADYQNEVQAAHGSRVTQPVVGRNRVVHRVENEAEVRVLPLTHEEVESLFRAIKAEIAEAVGRPRQLRVCQRDLAVFGTQYYFGLRISEEMGLTTKSFGENRATRQQLGKYGSAKVRGKSPGRAPKPTATTPALSVALGHLMKWYLRVVRPKFPDPRKSGALFLTERGTALTADAARRRLKIYLRRAGLDATAYSTHSFRRSVLTHASEVVDMTLAQYVARHRHLSTTQGYVREPEPALLARLSRIVDSTVAQSQRIHRRGR